jgi:hypothetical protein
MAKFFLLSIIIAMIALPTRAARHKNPREGLRKAVIHVAVYYAFYVAGLFFIYGRSGSVHALYMAAIVLTYRFI